ncbi:arginase family protein, partial [Mycobacterium tuberculosis]|nr:arginase family protein [Mycobacterium tuberculosis]
QRWGTRYGPRYSRGESGRSRRYNTATGAAPFDSLSVADIGDVPINTYSLLKSVQIIEDYYTGLNSYPLIPLTLGGDHTITLP